jgi:ABC-type lipoprotein release transport system permease subunit
VILVRIALRNLRLHRFKTAIVGSILMVGTALVVVGGSLLDAVDNGMKVSLINSVTAHLQLYSKKAKDKFQIFGNMDGSMPDSGRIDDFSLITKALAKVPSVKAVVPMGIDFAVSTTDNILQRKLAELRDAVRKNKKEEQRILKKHVRRIVRVLDKELKNATGLIDVKVWKKNYGDYESKLVRTRSDAFWTNFDSDPYGTLEYLENEIGPLAFAEDMIWVRYLGTDTELFAKTFDRFEIVDGKMIPPGKRGFLFNKKVYEDMVKNKTARRLDKIKEKLEQVGKTIATCDDCRTWIGFNVRQAASLVFQFDERAAKKVAAVLGAELSQKADPERLVDLMKSFMKMNDQTFKRRYKVFYDEIAPHLLLYSVPIGGEFVLTAYSRRGGYARRVPLKVYGTFRFRSLDKSPLAGGFNLVDIVSFRDLYGYMTEERKKEQAAIRKSVGIKDVKRGDADAMFNDGSLVDDTPEGSVDPAKLDLKAKGKRFTKALYDKVYSQKELHGGVALNAAVMLEKGVKLADATVEIKKALAAAGLEMNIVGWREASGLVGQLISVIRVVLFGAVFVIFIVAMIIINNSLLMSTMERTPEIGTMRAIGAQRGFIMRMFLIETLVLAGLFGGAGALLGSGIILWLQASGIPAATDFFYFLFAGPRLHPGLEPGHVIGAMIAVGFVALLSTLYPASIATRITPREAMSREE